MVVQELSGQAMDGSVQAAVVDLIVNGKTVQLPARTLADVVAAEGLSDARVATALNGDFVPALKRGTTPVSVGDRIEIVSPRQGG